MQTFIEWLETQNHLDENWKKWLSTAALAGSLALPSIGCNGPDCAVPSKTPSKYQQIFHSPAKEKEKQDLRNKANQLKQAGRTRGTFIQGQLQPDAKTIPSQSVTSPDADDYL
jgi:hypothetical protein